MHAVVTGPITGEVELPNGERIDVSGPFVLVDTPEKAAEVADAIGRHYAEQGHPTDENFTYRPEG